MLPFQNKGDSLHNLLSMSTHYFIYMLQKQWEIHSYHLGNKEKDHKKEQKASKLNNITRNCLKENTIAYGTRCQRIVFIIA